MAPMAPCIDSSVLSKRFSSFFAEVTKKITSCVIRPKFLADLFVGDEQIALKRDQSVQIIVGLYLIPTFCCLAPSQ